MSQIEMETEWLRSEILPKILKSGKLVDNYQESKYNTFKVRDIEIDVIGIEEAYMQTFCYRTTIDFEFDGQKLQRKLVVKKTHSMSIEDFKGLQFEHLFTNEINFYTQILPEIQILAGGKFPAPKYFYSELKPHSAVVILENFAEHGWRLTKDRCGLSLEHALKAVSYLGQFHGFAYAIKHRNPEKFTKLISGLRESRYANDEMHPTWFLTAQTGIIRAAKVVAIHQPQIEKAFVEKYVSLLADNYRYSKQRVAPREPLATICHGDYLRNNVAYRYNDREEPQEIMMFDYQTVRLSSPMIDLSLFLALSVYANVRYPNFDVIFDEYCSALFESYRKHAQDEVPQFMSRSELLKEYVRFLPFSITITAYFLLELVEPAPRVVDEEQLIHRIMTTGGELVDREIAHQMREMYELSQKCGISIDDGIDLEALSNK